VGLHNACHQVKNTNQLVPPSIATLRNKGINTQVNCNFPFGQSLLGHKVQIAG